MRTVWLIVAKDLRSRLRDRSAYIIGLVAPFALALVFSFVFSPTASDDLTFSFGVVDLDGGAVATAFREEILGQVEAQGVAQVTVVASEDAVREQLDAGDLDAAFVLPEGMTDAVSQSRPARLEVLGGADARIGTQAARSIARSFSASVTRVQASVHAATHTGAVPPDQIDALVARISQTADPVTLDTSEVASKELAPRTQYSAAMAIMFLFFTVQFGVVGYLEERREGTLSRLLVAVPHASILAGKALTSVVMGAVSMAVLLVAATLLMDADFGDPWGVTVLVAAGVLAAVAVVVVVTAFARSAEQAGNLQSMVGVLLAMFGGAFFPLSQSPDWMVAVSRITPHAWFLRGLGDLAAGGTVVDILPAAGAMALFAAVALVAAVVPIRRMVLR